jgi:hypothetical protein
MAFPSTTPSQFSEDVTWDSLKRAIAASSGFQRWRAEAATAQLQGFQLQGSQLQGSSLETLVSLYLRETLETLAY